MMKWGRRKKPFSAHQNHFSSSPSQQKPFSSSPSHQNPVSLSSPHQKPFSSSTSSQKPFSASPHPPSTSHVFPVSWLSKFKKMGGSSSLPKPPNAIRKGQKNSPSPSLPSRGSWTGGRFYGGDDDAYWRLSFGEDRENRRGRLKSVWYDSDDELVAPFSSPQSCKQRATKVEGGQESQKFSTMVSDTRRKTRGLPGQMEIQQEDDACKGKRWEAEIKMARKKVLKDQRSRKSNRSVFLDNQVVEAGLYKAEETSTKSVEKEIFKLEPERTIQTREEDDKNPTSSDMKRQQNNSLPNSSLRTIAEDCVVEVLKFNQSSAFSEEESSSDSQKMKNMKINELTLNSGKQKKSGHGSRESQRRRTKQGIKVRVYSPRTTAKVDCKIKALEDMKKAKTKARKTTKERANKDVAVLDSFAVVKSSFDPQQDFRDSMVEMITEQEISQPEELEELLACYLTLNSDDYHDLIIKVFRQVWFELNGAQFDVDLQFEHCYRA